MPPPDNKSVLEKATSRLTSLASSFVPSSLSPVSHEPHPTIKLPPFDSLQATSSNPAGSLWGVFNTPNSQEKDQLGTLNLLTPEIIRLASKEIKTGQHIQLDACLSTHVEFPGFGRKKFEQKIIDARSNGRHYGFDDELHLNTQSGSQWDSLRHFGHQATGKYYNGLTHTEAAKTSTNGIHAWCESGGIVGRGVLVDWVRWHEATKPTPVPSAVSRHEIPVSELDECLKWQGTTTRDGDILLVRSGYMRWHNLASTEERKRGTQENALAIGVENQERAVRWLYERHFAAVAGDTIAFEAWPPPFKTGPVLHEWLLALWGTPIGELWDLEKLSEMCEKENRWTFFLTSAPLHVKGGVGSPPGAIAIF